MKTNTSIRQYFQNLFRPKPNRFILRLHEQAELGLKGTAALVAYMTKPSKRNATLIRELEKQADEVRRILIDELNHTFVTPIDREDLFALSRHIDNVLDYAYSTTNEMDILQAQPNEYLLQMAQMLHESAEEILLAIERFEHHPDVANTHVIRVNAIENRMETLYYQALADLFQKPKDLDGIIQMLKLREIYRHMYHALQSAESAANIIGDIVMKFY